MNTWWRLSNFHICNITSLMCSFLITSINPQLSLHLHNNYRVILTSLKHGDTARQGITPCYRDAGGCVYNRLGVTKFCISEVWNVSENLLPGSEALWPTTTLSIPVNSTASNSNTSIYNTNPRAAQFGPGEHFSLWLLQLSGLPQTRCVM